MLLLFGLNVTLNLWCPDWGIILFSFWVFLLFVFVCSFTSSVSPSTCTNKLPLTFYLQIHDELKLTSPCRIIAPSSKGLQPLFSICCYTHLICLLSGLPIFTKVPPSTRYASTASTYQVVCQAGGFPRPVINWTRVGIPLPAGRTEVNQFKEH